MKKPAQIERAAIGKATVMSLSTNDGDGVSLQRILQCGNGANMDFECTVMTRSTLTSALSVLWEMPVPIVLWDCDLMPDAWREMLEYIPVYARPPLLILTSRVADERLWAEALNRGAYDVLVKPFDAAEVIRILSLAWQHWRQRHGGPASRTKSRKAASSA